MLQEKASDTRLNRTGGVEDTAWVDPRVECATMAKMANISCTGQASSRSLSLSLSRSFMIDLLVTAIQEQQDWRL